MKHSGLEKLGEANQDLVGNKKKAVTLTQKVLWTLTAMSVALDPVPAMAQIIAAGNGANVKTDGNVTKVWAGSVTGDVGVNVFKEYKLDAGKIANMYFNEMGKSNYVNNLVNFVNGRIDINGTVNAIRANQIGGNLFFLSKDGMAVGAGGVINAGSLTVMTPTAKYLQDIGLAEKDGSGAADGEQLVIADAAVDTFKKVFVASQWKNVSELNIPMNPSGTITVQGQINTVDGVALKAAHIDVSKAADAATGISAPKIITGEVDFSDLVNTKDAAGNIVSAGLDDTLKAVKTGSGNIVLTAVADSVNTRDDSYNKQQAAVENNVIRADIKVGKDAVLDAAGNAVLQASAENGQGQSGFFGKDDSEAATSDLTGKMAKTVADIQVDGQISGQKTVIQATAKNSYVAGALTDTAGLAPDIEKYLIVPVDDDLSSVELASSANVHIGETADITAKAGDALQKDAAGNVIDAAMVVKAESILQSSAGSTSAAGKQAAKMQQKAGIVEAAGDDSQHVPNAGITYNKTDNQAHVQVDGKITSQGGMGIQAKADSTVEAASSAAAPTNDKEQGTNNFVNAAITQADVTNQSSVVLSGAAKTAAGDMAVRAISSNTVTTSAAVKAGEVTMADTAINITDVNDSATINVDSKVQAANADIQASNTVTNNITAKTAVGMSKKQVNKASRKLKRAAALNGTLGKALAKSYAPGALEKMGALFTAGASVGVVNETNKAGVTLTRNAQITAADAQNKQGSLKIGANNTIEDSIMQVEGKTTNQRQDTNTEVMVNASVLDASLDNKAEVVIEGSKDGKRAALKGGNVSVQANSAFAYKRLQEKLDSLQTLIANAESIYAGKDAVLAELKTLSESVAGLLKNPGEASYQDCVSAGEKLVDILSNGADGADTGMIDNIKSLASSAMDILNGPDYANFYVTTSTSGKKTETADLAVAGAVNINKIGNTAQVIVGREAKLEAADELSLQAKAEQTDVNFNGKLKFIIPKGSKVSGAEVAVGGNVGYHEADVNSLVAVAEGAELSGSSLDLTAENKVAHRAATFGGGKGGAAGVTGMAAYLEGNSNSLVSVDDEAKLRAKTAAGENAVSIQAKNKTNIENIIYDKTAGGTAVGAALGDVTYGIQNAAAVTDNDKKTETKDGSLQQLTQKLLGDATEQMGSEKTKVQGSVEAAQMQVKAETTGEIDTLSVAGVDSGSSDKKDKKAAAAGSTAASTAGSGLKLPADIGAAGSVSLNRVQTGTTALVEGTQVRLTGAQTDKTLSVQAVDDTLIGAYSGASAVHKQGKTADSNFSATLAGAVAYNAVTADVRSAIRNTTVQGADQLLNKAEKGGVLLAAGLALGVEKGSSNGATGVNAAVSGSFNENTTNVQAQLDGVSVNGDAAGTNKTKLENIAQDKDIQVAGGLTAQAVKSTMGLGAAVSQQDITNTVQASLTGSSLKRMADVTVEGVSAITEVGTALSVGIISGQSSNGVEGAAAINKLTNKIMASVDGTSIQADDVTVLAHDGKQSADEKDNTHRKALAEAGYDVEGADAMADVNAQPADTSIAADDPAAGSKTKEEKVQYQQSTFKAADNKGNLIVTGAAGITLNKSQSGAVTAGAAVADSTIDNEFQTTVHNADIQTAKQAKIQAVSDTLQIGAVAGAAASKAQSGLALAGSAAVQKQTNHTTTTVEASTITAKFLQAEAKTSSRLINTAGQLSAAKGNAAIGLASATNMLDNTTGVYLRGNTVQALKQDSVAVDVLADNSSKTYAITAGVTADSNASSVAANGTVSVNQGENHTEAVVEQQTNESSIKKNTFDQVGHLTVKAQDTSVQKAIAGSAAMGSGYAAIGGAVAYNEIGSLTGSKDTEKKQRTIAKLDQSAVTFADTAADSVGLQVNADDSADILTIAAGVVLSNGSTGIAASGSAATALVGKQVEASLADTTVQQGKLKQDIHVRAANTAKVVTSADSAALTTSNVAVGAGVAVNRTEMDTTAKVAGGRIQAGDVEVRAAATDSILNIGLGVAGTTGTGGSVAGNVSVNHIANDTQALMQDHAVVDASGDLAVVADSQDTIKNYTGAMAVTAGQGYLSGGAATVVNQIDGSTKAGISDSTVSAAGGAGYAIDGETTKHTGLIVAAKAKHTLHNIAATAGAAANGSVTVSGSGTAAVNKLSGTTSASVERTDINKDKTLQDKADVAVLADDTAETKSLAGAVAAAVGADGGAAVGAAADTNILDRTVQAGVYGNSSLPARSNVQADQLQIAANQSDTIVTNAAGAAVAAGVYGAGSIAGAVAVTRNTATTVAEAVDLTGNNNGLSIQADHKTDITLTDTTLAVSGAMIAGSGGLTAAVLNDESNTRASLKDSDFQNGTTAGADSVRAANTTKVTTAATSAALSASIGGAISGTVAVNNFNNQVQAEVTGTNIGRDTQAAASFDVDAQNTLQTDFNMAAGTAGVGAAAVGVAVNTIDSSVTAGIADSTIHTGSFTEQAGETRDITQRGISGAAGGIGLAANVMLTNIGTKVQEQYDVSADQTADDAKTRESKTVDTEKKLADVDKVVANQDTYFDAASTDGVIGNEKGENGIADSSTTGVKMGSAGIGSDDLKSKAVVGRGGTADGKKAAGVAANLQNSTVIAAGKASIGTRDVTDVDMHTYQGGASTLAINGTVGILDAVRQNKINIESSTLQADTIQATAGQSGTISQNIMQGSIDSLSVNAAYAKTALSGQNDINLLGADLQAEKNLQISTQDTTRVDSKAIGVHAGTVATVAILADIAENSSTSTIHIGEKDGKKTTLIAGDGTIGVTAQRGVSAEIRSAAKKAYEDSYAGNGELNNAQADYDQALLDYANAGSDNKAAKADAVDAAREKLKEARNAAIKTAEEAELAVYENKEGIRVQAIPAAAAGAAAAIGFKAEAKDLSQSTIMVDDGNTFQGAAGVNLHAVNNSVNTVRAAGVDVAGGVSVDVSKAKVESSAGASVKVGGTNTFRAGSATVSLQANVHSANQAVMKSIGASLGAAVMKNTAELTEKTNAAVQAGSNTYVADTLSLQSSADTLQHADAKSVSASGLIASGTNRADVQADDTVTAEGDGMQDGSQVRNVSVQAVANTAHQITSNGDGGAAVDISPYAAEGSNAIQGTTAVTLKGNWKLTGDMSVQALHLNRVNLDINALKAAVVDLSGVSAKNSINNTTTITYGTDKVISGGSQSIQARNGLDVHNQVQGGGYGALAGAAVKADDTLNLTGKVTVKDGSKLFAGKTMTVSALTGDAVYQATGHPEAIVDKNVKIASAGIAAGTMAKSTDNVTFENTIQVEKDARIETTGNPGKDADLRLTAADRTNLQDETTADTQGGGVGAASSTVQATVHRSNKVSIGGTVDSNYDTNLDAGDTSVLNLNLKSNAYNKTAAPLRTAPSLDTDVQQTNQIDIAKGAVVQSLRNITLSADTGDTTIGQQAASWKWTQGGGASNASLATTMDGSGTQTGTQQNSININGSVLAGKNHELKIVIDDTAEGRAALQKALDDYAKNTMQLDKLKASLQDKEAAYADKLAADGTKKDNEALAAIDEQINSRNAAKAVVSASVTKAEADRTAASDALSAWENTQYDNYKKAVLVDPLTKEEYLAQLAGTDLADYKAKQQAVKDAAAEVDHLTAQLNEQDITDLQTQRQAIVKKMEDEAPELKTLREAVAAAQAEYDAVLEKSGSADSVNQAVFKDTDLAKYLKITVPDWYEKQYGTAAAQIGFIDYAKALTGRLSELTKLEQEYSGTNTSNAYKAEIVRIEQELVALGLGRNTGTDGTFVYEEGASTVPTVALKDITVSGGDIQLNTQALQGTGNLTANGTPVVEITNNSAYYLRTGSIRIDGEGGSVYLNDNTLQQAPAGITLNAVMGKSATGENAKIILSGTTPLKGADSQLYTPDIGVFGTLDNPYGSITINNAHNNIYISGASGAYDGKSDSGTGAIKGRTVTLVAGGSITQGYTDGIVNIGGDPHYAVNAEYIQRIQAALINLIGNKTDTASYYTAFKTEAGLKNFLQKYVKSIKTDQAMTEAEASDLAAALIGKIAQKNTGIYASGGIYVGASNINVNGRIQSGYDTYVLDLDDTKAAKLMDTDYQGPTASDSQFRTDAYKVSGTAAGAVFDEAKGKYVYHVQAWYNPSTKQIFTEDIDQSGGGRISLAGAIANTNSAGGELVALNGGSIYNLDGSVLNRDGKFTLKTGSINADNVQGKISIFDTNNMTSPKEYTATEGNTTVESYDPLAGQRYIWTNGASSRTVTTKRHETDTKWWGAKESDWEKELSEMDEADKIDLGTVTENSTPTKNGDLIVKARVEKTGRGYESTAAGSEGKGVNYVDTGDQPKDETENSQSVYQIDFERSVKRKQAVDKDNKPLYTDSSGKLTTEKTDNPVYQTDQNNKPVYELEISKPEVTVKKKGLFGLWGKHETKTWTESRGMLTAYNFAMKADNKIRISFLGEKESTINLNGNSDILLGGDMRAGNINIKTTNGSISYLDNAELVTDKLNLAAAKNINVRQQGVKDSLNLTAKAGADITVLAKAGTAAAGGLAGIVNVQSIDSDQGVVTLQADGSIQSAGTAAGADIEGNSLYLTSAGGIGSADRALTLGIGKGGVNAQAKDGIYLNQKNTTMYIGEIASGQGDVVLTADQGGFADAFLDNSKQSASDTERIRDWQKLGLLAGGKAAANSQENQQANLEAQASNIAVQLKDGKKLVDAGQEFAAAMKPKQQAAAAAQTEMYAKQALLNKAIAALGKDETEPNKTAYAAALADYNTAYAAYAKAESSYKADKQAYLADTGAEAGSKAWNWLQSYEAVRNADASAYGWTEKELLYAIQDSVINPKAGNITDVQTANIRGNNITLNTVGDIGTVADTQRTVLNTASLFDEKTDNIAGLKKLAQAKPGDVTWSDDQIVIERTKPVSVQLNQKNGVVTLNTKDSAGAMTKNIYLIAKDSPLNIKEVQAQNNVRLMAHEGIQGIDGQSPVISGRNILLEGGRGSIGTLEKEAQIALQAGGRLSANAQDNIYLQQQAGLNTDIVLGSIAARNIAIEAAGNIVSDPDGISYLNAGEHLTLDGLKSIGSSAGDLRIRNSGAVLDLSAGDGAYLTAKQDGTLVLGTIRTGGPLSLRSEGSIELGRTDDPATAGDEHIDGSINTDKAAQDVQLTAAEDIDLQGTIRANDLFLQSVNGSIGQGSQSQGIIQADRLRVAAVNGSILLGQKNNEINKLELLGIGKEFTFLDNTKSLTLDLGGVRNVQGGDFAVKNAGSLLIQTTGNAPAVIEGSLTLQAGDALENQGRIQAVKHDEAAGTNTQIILQSAAGSVTNAATGSLTSAGSVTLDATQGKAVNQGSIYAHDQIHLLSGAGDTQNEGSLQSDNDISLQAEKGAVKNSNTIIAGGSVILDSKAGSVENTGSLLAGKDVDIQAEAGDILHTGSIETTQGNVQMHATGNIENDGTLLAGDSAELTAENGRLSIGGTITTKRGAMLLRTLSAEQGGIAVDAELLTQAADDKGNMTIQTNKGDIRFRAGATVAGSGTLTVHAEDGSITDKVVKTAVPFKAKAAGRMKNNLLKASNGDVALKSLNGSVDAYTGKGDVDLYEVFAKENASTGTGTGGLTLYKINGKLVALRLEDMDHEMEVQNTTVGQRMIIEGNKIALDDISQRNGENGLLNIDLNGVSTVQPIAKLNMNFTRINKGLWFDRIWADQAKISTAGDKFYIDKLAVMGKAVFEHNGMTTSVYGNIPRRNDNTSSYWYKYDTHNPADDSADWRSHSQIGEWMNLYFGLNGKQQTSNGVLLDLQEYNYAYNQRQSAIDYSRNLLRKDVPDVYTFNFKPLTSGYSRLGLLDMSGLETAGTPVQRNGQDAAADGIIIKN